MLHNETFVEAAQGLAKRVLTAGGNMEDAFVICFAREGSGSELNEMKALLVESREWYGENVEAAKEMANRHRPEGVEASEFAAWVATLRVLLNTDEFLTRE